MKSLQARFNQVSQKNPLWSTYICFAEAIRGQQFSRSIMHRWFQKLVDKNDYTNSEKKGILKHLEDLTNQPRRAKNKDKNNRQED